MKTTQSQISLDGLIAQLEADIVRFTKSAELHLRYDDPMSYGYSRGSVDMAELVLRELRARIDTRISKQ